MNLRINPTIFKAKFLLLRYHWWAAFALIAVFFGLSFGAMVGDSAIVDELAHVPAAYSYVHYGDYRLNPEHPPLLKDLAGIPLQFLHLNFPTNSSAWTAPHPEQYSVGYEFLYRVGNDAKTILFWARLPLLILATAFGLLFYWIIYHRFGKAVGLIALFFYALSPNFLAHSHYVATDVGASIGMFLGLIAFIRFLEAPSRKTILLLSLALALAQLTKFSSVLLYSYFLMIWLLIAIFGLSKQRIRLFKGIISASILSILWIYLAYLPNTLALSGQRQADLFTFHLSAYPLLYHGIGPFLSNLCLPWTQFSSLRPLLQYILGLGMVAIRIGSENVGYFNGVVSLQSFPWYFPEIFLLKTQVSFIILLIGFPLTAIVSYLRKTNRNLAKIKPYIASRYFELILIGFAIYYFITAVRGSLNIGIRHLLPIYLPLFATVAISLARLVRTNPSRHLILRGVTVVLLLWYGLSGILAFPYYTAYFNGLAGGPNQASRYFNDSGIDWGQDLDRLKEYTDKHPEIHKLALDYFGGGMPPYTFCKHIYGQNHRQLAGDAGIDCSQSIYEEWHAYSGAYHGQYIAVSETYLLDDIFYSGNEYAGGYGYLRSREPMAKIGYSIYLYKLY